MQPVLLAREIAQDFGPAEPLWQRAPTRDEEGRLLADFMMLIPGMKAFPQDRVTGMLDKLNKLFGLYQEYVVFADLNLKLNVLWVSHRSRPGLGAELAAAIHTLIPEAKLVAQHHE